MFKHTIYLPVAMMLYFKKRKKRLGITVAEQMRAILQAFIDSHPL